VIRTRGSINRYYIGSRLIDLPEAQALFDALESSRTISRTRTDNLVGRIGKLLSVHQADQLSRRKMVCNALKTDNSHVIYSMDIVNRAIEQQKKILFQYYTYEPGKGRTLRHNGAEYSVSPFGMVWNDDKYYLIGWCDSHNAITHFRLDRMLLPVISEENAVREPDGFTLSEYTKGMFHMFGGEQTLITLRCSNAMMSAITDHFGESIDVIPLGDDSFTLTVWVALSSTFFSWVFQFGGEVEIQQPTYVRKAYLDMLQQAIATHQNP